MLDRIIILIASFLALLLVLPIHEFAHAFVAVKFGDITPKIYKRYTINPFAHFDLLGLVCFAFAGFGWAKPVPINPNNFTKYKSGCFFVSIAGVVANYLLAFLVYPLIYLSLYLPDFGLFTFIINLTLLFIFNYSLSFFVFNLIPFYPLDGFRVVDAFSKKRSIVYRFLRDYGRYILLFFIFLSILADYLDIWQLDVLGYAINFVVEYIKMPIVWFWGLFF